MRTHAGQLLVGLVGVSVGLVWLLHVCLGSLLRYSLPSFGCVSGSCWTSAGTVWADCMWLLHTGGLQGDAAVSHVVPALC